ncbi:DUF6188 family protein [Streptomyces sp. NPDC059718]
MPRTAPGTGADLAPVLDLFGQSVTSAHVRDDGAVALGFDSGAHLWIEPDPRLTSWHLTGPDVPALDVGPDR